MNGAGERGRETEVDKYYINCYKERENKRYVTRSIQISINAMFMTSITGWRVCPDCDFLSSILMSRNIENP